ncbi:DUF4957 domain-containing protein [Sphingobacterium litopenaei]|uniref:Fibronectin type III domain-containing protein n=1 Tax=Sphingobacterium litopenaei TaxID=2763500 RepID=A0ABR7YBX1_9SPHI|nr:DUF4957 domain-containing protein [Sphingobacterium litopenaei]MBD1428802.1 fibronectin type III domain-containing protein [Sphingobacterium litopenaei]
MKPYKIFGLVTTALALTFVACDSNLTTEISELHLDRALSPTNVVAQVVERTSVRLNWKKVYNASAYHIEFYDNPAGTGTAVKRIENIQYDELPYTVAGLDGETEYLVKIQAVGSDIGESKWSTATFTTGTEQILRAVDPEEITSSSAILRWPAGLTATSVELSPGNRYIPVTAENITNGSITIEGLGSDITYTARLMNGAKTRGTISFTTMLGDNVTKIGPSEDFAAILATLQDGDIIALEPGEYKIEKDLEVSKTITIQGYRPADKPVLKGLVLKVKGGAGLTLKDVIMDGTGNPSQNQSIFYDEDMTSAYGELSIENSEFKNYVKGLLYVNKKVRISKATYSNNLIYNIECAGGDFIDFRNGLADEFYFRNNTVYNSVLARDLFRMDAGGSTNFPGIQSKIYIENNIFHKVLAGTSNRMLYIRLASHQIYFSKNIVSESNGLHSNQAATTITQMTQNNYHNAPNFTGSTASNAKNDTGNFTLLNPQFTNADAGNFTLGNLDLKLNGIGPERWRN